MLMHFKKNLENRSVAVCQQFTNLNPNPFNFTEKQNSAANGKGRALFRRVP